VFRLIPEYNSDMRESSDVIDRVLDPLMDCFTPEVARNVVNLRADTETQARLGDLAQKANDGQLTPQEEAIYDRFLEAFHFVTILQAKAREFLRRQNQI
jgi:hypothetical protein